MYVYRQRGGVQNPTSLRGFMQIVACLRHSVWTSERASEIVCVCVCVCVWVRVCVCACVCVRLYVYAPVCESRALQLVFHCLHLQACEQRFSNKVGSLWSTATSSCRLSASPPLQPQPFSRKVRLRAFFILTASASPKCSNTKWKFLLLPSSRDLQTRAPTS